MKKRELAGITIFAGAWLFATTLTFGPDSLAMLLSDLLCGILLMVFGGLVFRSTHPAWGWAICGVGLWLQIAPLIFWAPLAVTYITNTLVGVVAILLSFGLTPLFAEGKSVPPPGWSYNPSSWGYRLPTIFFGALSWFLARYLAAFQLGYIDTITDPIFGLGTYQVVTSTVSQAFPVSDAGLGAFGYTLDVLTGALGDNRRYKTAPWATILFGIFVVPAGIISIILIILQPVVVKAWCSWCLLTALSMLIMIVFTVGEFVASLQYVIEKCKQGRSFWPLFWKGERADEREVPDESSIFSSKGITLPWNLLVSAAIGLWLVFVPSIFPLTPFGADVDFVIGTLIIVTSIIALAEVVRSFRFFNILLGIALIVLPWLDKESLFVLVHPLILGVAIILLAFPRGPIRQRYGSWSRHIF